MAPYLINDWASADVGTGVLEGDLEGDAVGFSNIATNDPLFWLAEELGIVPYKTK